MSVHARVLHPGLKGWRCCVALGLVWLAPGCLPELSPELLVADDAGRDVGPDGGTSRCLGGVPNGVLEEDEPCDDGNLLADDGCSQDCDLECDGLFDDQTGTCYFIASPSLEPVSAVDRCAGHGMAHVVTIRTKRERDLVAGWLAQSDLDRVLLALVADEEPTRWRSLVAGEPGWSSNPSCPGCYASWADKQPVVSATLRLAAASRSVNWNWVTHSAKEPLGLVCERPRPGRPKNLCALPTCDPGSTFEFQWQDRRFRVRETAARVTDAQADCRAWGGHLVTVRSEQEREILVRFGPSSRFWLGLARQTNTDVWRWLDGSNITEVPVLWSSTIPGAGHSATVLDATSRFDTRLIEPVTGLGQLPYICGKPIE